MNRHAVIPRTGRAPLPILAPFCADANFVEAFRQAFDVRSALAEARVPMGWAMATH